MPDKVMIGEYMGRTKTKFINRPSNRFVVPDADIGMEFEYEKVRGVPDTLSKLYWKAKEDHSLHDRGLEFVFSQPMFGEDADRAIKELMTCAEENGWACSPRTGIHVHLDVRDLARTQFIGMLVYYTLFEPLIYAWVGNGRDCNNFCLPLYKAEESLALAIQLANALFTEGKSGALVAQRTADQYGRYAGLNLRAMSQYGSMEFRHLQTTKSQDRVYDWINLILALKRAAQLIPTSTTQGLLEPLLRNDYEGLVFQIFGGRMGEQLLASGTLAEVKDLGLPNALRILSTTDKLFVPMPKKKADIYGPWDRDDGEPPEKAITKSHSAIRKWETLHFPKSDGQQPNEADPAGQNPYNPQQAGVRAVLPNGVVNMQQWINTMQPGIGIQMTAGTAQVYMNPVNLPPNPENHAPIQVGGNTFDYDATRGQYVLRR